MKYWIIAVITALGAVWFTACKGSGTIRAGTTETVPVVPGFQIEAEITWGRNDGTVRGLPPGSKIDVGFVDANGDPVGEPHRGVGNGETRPIPPGAVDYTWQFPSTGPGGESTPANPRGHRGFGRIPWNRVMGFGSLDPALSDIPTVFTAGLTISDSVDFWSAYEIIRPLVYNPIGAVARPSTVEPYIWLQVTDISQDGARFVWADTEDFVTFDFQWNGTSYADLNTNSTRYTVGNWFALGVYIPRADFNGGPWGSDNSAESVWRTVSDVDDIQLSGFVIYN